MGRWFISALLLALVGVVAGGCAHPVRATNAQSVVQRDLLFSPAWTGLPTYDVARAQWPSSVGHESLGEVVDYRETIIDRHGLAGLQRDFYYRRFESVRTGRSYR